MADPIAALATAPGEGGIAIVRLSGDGVRHMTSLRFSPAGQTPAGEIPPRRMAYGAFLDKEGTVLDRILWVWFAAPRSYTGEEVVELHCHGGYLGAQRLLLEVLDLGCRPAAPGEFTQRAFLNGRLDLAQAEGVLGLIRARNDEALHAAQRALGGGWGWALLPLRGELLGMAATVQASLDFPDEDLPPWEREDLVGRLKKIRERLQEAQRQARSGALLSTGWRVALVGRPNVGKSSLLNALLQQSRAIVTALPGTTRDVVEEVLSYRGVPFRLLDTAGIRPAQDPAEREGVARALHAAEEADLRLWVLDASEPLLPEDWELGKSLREKGRLLAVRNKSDLPERWDEGALISLLGLEAPVITISAQQERGITALKDLLWHMAVGEDSLEGALHASARQCQELRQAELAVARAEEALDPGYGEDLLAQGLQEALQALDRLLGFTWDDALLNEIFSRFCVGK